MRIRGGGNQNKQKAMPQVPQAQVGTTCGMLTWGRQGGTNEPQGIPTGPSHPRQAATQVGGRRTNIESKAALNLQINIKSSVPGDQCNCRTPPKIPPASLVPSHRTKSSKPQNEQASPLGASHRTSKPHRTFRGQATERASRCCRGASHRTSKPQAQTEQGSSWLEEEGDDHRPLATAESALCDSTGMLQTAPPLPSSS